MFKQIIGMAEESIRMSKRLEIDPQQGLGLGAS